MVEIRKKSYETNVIEAIVYYDGIFWLSEKDVKEGLHYKNFREITRKYYSNHRKHTYELVE